MPTPGERLDRASGTQPYREESRALDPREVTIQPGWNVRDMSSHETREWIATLKASILARGLDKPISIRYERKTGTQTHSDCKAQGSERKRGGHEEVAYRAGIGRRIGPPCVG